MLFQAIYLVADVGTEHFTLCRVGEILSQSREAYYLRCWAGSRWVQVVPCSAEGQVEKAQEFLLRMLERGKLPQAPSLSEQARRLAALLAAETIALESETSSDYFEYSRWDSGRLVRMLTRSPQDPSADSDGWLTKAGRAESWEIGLLDEGAELTAREIGIVLGLPGFGTIASAEPCTIELRICPA